MYVEGPPSSSSRQIDFLQVHCRDYYYNTLKPCIDAWERLDREEYTATCIVLQILHREGERIYDPVNDPKLLDRVHDFWFSWKDSKIGMSSHYFRERMSSFASFVADRFAVMGNPEDAILVTKQSMELQDIVPHENVAASVRWNLLVSTRYELAGYYIVAERVGDAINELQTLRSELWARLAGDNSLLPDALEDFRTIADIMLWFQNDWCKGDLAKYKKDFQAEFVNADGDQRAAEAMLQDAGLLEAERTLLEDVSVRQMAEVFTQRQHGTVIMWDLPWQSPPVSLLLNSSEEQSRWKWLRSKYRLQFRIQHYIDRLYEIFREEDDQDD